jgi:hypothetical protein
MSEVDVFLPLLFKVRHFRYNPTAENDLGTSVEAWEDPTEIEVYGWGPPQSEGKTVLEGDARTVIQVELMVPPGFISRPDDRFQLGSTAEVEEAPDYYDTYRQVGPLEDYTHNPFGWNPGSVVNLIAIGGGKV